MVAWDPTFGLSDVLLFILVGALGAYFFLRVGLPRIRRSMIQSTYYQLQDAANFSLQLKNLTAGSTTQPPETAPPVEDKQNVVPM